MPQTFEEMFESVFPYYLSIGMTYNQFWLESPYLAISYRNAHRLRNEQKNEEMYIQGLYTFEAITTAMSNLHFDGKHHKFNTFRDKPFEIYEKDEAEKEREAEEMRKKLIERFKSFNFSWEGGKKCQ